METAETDALTERMTPTHFSVLRQEKKWRNVKKVLMMVIPIARISIKTVQCTIGNRKTQLNVNNFLVTRN